MEYIEGDEFEDIHDDMQYSPRPKRKDAIVENFSSPLPSGDHDYFREKELNLLQKTFLKKEKKHLAIKGEIGTGRETLIKTLSKKTNQDVLSSLYTYQVRILDLNYLVSGVKSRNQIEETVLALHMN